MITEDRLPAIRFAAWVAVVINALLAFSKLSIGFYAHSFAVVGDGVDSFFDVFTSFITLYTARLMAKPPNAQYPYGYKRADSLAARAVSFIVFFAGAQLAIATISRFYAGDVREIPSTVAVYVTIFSIVLKYLLSFYLLKKAKNLESSMLKANGKNMQFDVMISFTVLAGLGLTFYMKQPLLDAITALLISLYIMYGAVGMFLENNVELMDGVKNPEIYKKVFDAVLQVRGALNPHRVRVRQLGNMYAVELDIEVDGAMCVSESHKIATDVEQCIELALGNVYDVNVHVEPFGIMHKVERFGVSRKDLD